MAAHKARGRIYSGIDMPPAKPSAKLLGGLVGASTGGGKEKDIKQEEQETVISIMKMKTKLN
jgi:hypothetical protein